MKRCLLVLNHAFLFLCVSMYLGTGWSLILFSFPVAPKLTPDTYWLQFVPQVTAATKFFTGMTAAMLVAGLIMCWSEWRTRFRWVPIVVLLMIVAATGLTMWKIFPYNKEMDAGIHDQARLTEVLTQWMRLNVVRVSLWTVQWLCMMKYFASRALQMEQPK